MSSRESTTRAGVFFSLIHDIQEASGVDLVRMARQLERSEKRQHNGLAAKVETLLTMGRHLGDQWIETDLQQVRQDREIRDLHERLLLREWANGARKESDRKTWEILKVILAALASAALAAAGTAWALLR